MLGDRISRKELSNMVQKLSFARLSYSFYFQKIERLVTISNIHSLCSDAFNGNCLFLLNT